MTQDSSLYICMVKGSIPSISLASFFRFPPLPPFFSPCLHLPSLVSLALIISVLGNNLYRPENLIWSNLMVRDRPTVGKGLSDQKLICASGRWRSLAPISISVCLSVCLSLCLSVCLSLCLSVSLSLFNLSGMCGGIYLIKR